MVCGFSNLRRVVLRFDFFGDRSFGIATQRSSTVFDAGLVVDG